MDKKNDDACGSNCKPFGGPPTLFWTLDPEPCTLDLGSRTLNLFVNRFVMHWLLLCSTLGAFWAILVSSLEHFGGLQSHLGSSWAILGNPGVGLGQIVAYFSLTYAQDHFVEMQKSLPIGPCRVKSRVLEHASSTITSYLRPRSRC